MTTPSRSRTRRVVLSATLALAAAGGGFVTMNAASAATSVTGQITGMAGKCLGAAGGNTANGTRADMYSCVGSTTQQWTLPGDARSYRRQVPGRGAPARQTARPCGSTAARQRSSG
jgi:hypothetical protein